MMVGGACLWLSTAMAWAAMMRNAMIEWLHPPRITAVYKVWDEGEAGEQGQAKVLRLRASRRLTSIRAEGAAASATFFVRYRVAGRTFWWWPDVASTDFCLPETSEVRKQRVYKARLTGDMCTPEDVTDHLAALAGHSGDFHGKELTPEVVRRFVEVVSPGMRHMRPHHQPVLRIHSFGPFATRCVRM